jgi:hypothetical protein
MDTACGYGACVQPRGVVLRTGVRAAVGSRPGYVPEYGGTGEPRPIAVDIRAVAIPPAASLPYRSPDADRWSTGATAGKGSRTTVTRQRHSNAVSPLELPTPQANAANLLERARGRDSRSPHRGVSTDELAAFLGAFECRRRISRNSGRDAPEGVLRSVLTLQQRRPTSVRRIRWREPWCDWFMIPRAPPFAERGTGVSDGQPSITPGGSCR